MLKDAGHLLAGYSKHIPLVPSEWSVLRTLIASRLVQSCIMSSYSHSKDPKNEYLLITQEPGWKALEKFVNVPEKTALAVFKAICQKEQNRK